MKKYLYFLILVIFTLLFCNERQIPMVRAESPSVVLTLEQARQLAVSHNRDLQTLRLNLQMAIDKTIEARSKAFPQISSSASYTTHLEQPGRYDPVNKTEMPGGDRQLYEAKLSLEQSLFHLGIRAGIQAAKSYREVEKLKGERFQQTLDYLVTEQYLGLLRLQKEHDVLKELEKNTEEHLRDTQNFYREGLVPKTDLLRTELKLSQVQRDVLRVENQQQKSWTSFSILLGIPVTEVYQLQDVEYQEATRKGIEGLQAEALLRRKDLQQILAEKVYQENLLKAYQSKRYPVISAFGSWDYTSNEYDLHHDNMTGGIRLSWPIFTGFGVTSQIAQARSQVARNQLQYQDLAARIYQEVESGYLDLQEARKNLETARKEIAQAEENKRISKDLYKESMATNTDVLDAQMLLAQARNNFNAARYDQILATQKLTLAIGCE